jgi:cytidylate kinase
MSAEKLYINLIGQAGAGKSTVANHLAERYDFRIFRPSDVVRAFARQQGIALRARQDYIDCHRTMYDKDHAVMTRAVTSGNDQPVCVDGLRAPVEVQELQRHCGMLVVALVCPLNVRFARVQADQENRQHRDKSNIGTLEEFVADEFADNSSSDPRDPNVEAVMMLADYVIDTSRELPHILCDVDELLKNQQT